MTNIVDISQVLLEMGLSGSVTEEERAICAQALVRAHGAIKAHLLYDPIQLSRTEYYPQADLDVSGAASGIWEVSEGPRATIRRVAAASTTELQLRHLPIRSITSVFVDYDGRFGTRGTSFGSGTEKTEGSDYWPDNDGVDSDGNAFCTDGILRSVGFWPLTPGSVKVVYTAGYSDKEFQGQDTLIDASPIWSACLDEAIRRAKRALVVYRKKTGAGHHGLLTSEHLGDYSYTADGAFANAMFGGASINAANREQLSNFVRRDLGVH